MDGVAGDGSRVGRERGRSEVAADGGQPRQAPEAEDPDAASGARRGGAIAVAAPGQARHPTPPDLLFEANRRYLAALRDHPDWEGADRAEMARAEINERLGPDYWAAAILSFETVVQEHPSSDLVPDALDRSEVHGGPPLVLGRL